MVPKHLSKAIASLFIKLNPARYPRTITASILLIVSLSFNDPVSAETSVSGTISSNEEWTVENSPYTVTGHVTVASGVTLTIDPGVTVKLDSGKVLDIEGTLIAQGTSSDKITFTSSASSPAAGDWKFIRFNSSAASASFDNSGDYSSGSILQYCTIEYAGYGAPYPGSTQAVRQESSTPFIDNCTIQHNADGAIGGTTPENSTTKITNNTIDDNAAHGIKISFGSGTTFTIDGNTVSNSTYVTGNNHGGGDGILPASGSGPATGTISNNIVSGNARAGIRTNTGSAGSFDVTISNNSILNNGNYGLVTAAGGSSNALADSITASDNTITGNGGGIAAGAEPDRPTLVTTTIKDNVILNNSAMGVLIGLASGPSNPTFAGSGQSYGGCSEGVDSSPIHLFSVSSNTIIGNSQGAIASCHYAGGTFTNNKILDNGASNQMNTATAKIEQQWFNSKHPCQQDNSTSQTITYQVMPAISLSYSFGEAPQDQ